MPPILMIASVIIDDIVIPSGESRPNVLGGAATFASVGAVSWWPSVAIVAGVGRDFETIAGDRLTRLGLQRVGLQIRGEHTIRNRLVYCSGGTERTETPVFGLDHFLAMQTTPDDIPAALLPAVGTYMFADLNPAFWSAFHRRRELLGVTLWELHAASATQASWPVVQLHLPTVDIVSLNIAEAESLLSVCAPQAIASKLLMSGASIVVLRMGAEGALIARRRQRLRVFPPRSSVVDVTGAGNTFCGGFLAAWCATQNLERAARAAAAVAAQCIARYGPPEQIDSLELQALAAATQLENVGWTS